MLGWSARAFFIFQEVFVKRILIVNFPDGLTNANIGEIVAEVACHIEEGRDRGIIGFDCGNVTWKIGKVSP